MGKFKLALLGSCPICLLGLETYLKRQASVEIAGIFTPEELLPAGQALPRNADLWIVYFDGNQGIIESLGLGDSSPLVYPFIVVYNRSAPPKEWITQTHHASAFLLHESFAEEIHRALKIIELGGIYVTGKLKNQWPLIPVGGQRATSNNGSDNGSDNGIASNWADSFLASLNKLYPQLSVREAHILQRLLEDPSLSYKEIGSQFGIEEDTVKKHMSNIGSKIGMKGRKAILKQLWNQINREN